MPNHRDANPHVYRSAGGVLITRTSTSADASELPQLTRELDTRRGLLLRSSFEYPGRYRRRAVGFLDPMLVLEGRERSFRITALNQRGALLLPTLGRALRSIDAMAELNEEAGALAGTVCEGAVDITEEQRTRQPSLLSVVRAVRDCFAADDDGTLGLYGAFGYDLVFGIEALTMQKERDPRNVTSSCICPTSSSSSITTRQTCGASATTSMSRKALRQIYRAPAHVSLMLAPAPLPSRLERAVPLRSWWSARTPRLHAATCSK